MQQDEVTAPADRTGRTGFGAFVSMRLASLGWSAQDLVRHCEAPEAHVLALTEQAAPGDIALVFRACRALLGVDTVCHDFGTFRASVQDTNLLTALGRLSAVDVEGLLRHVLAGSVLRQAPSPDLARVEPSADLDLRVFFETARTPVPPSVQAKLRALMARAVEAGSNTALFTLYSQLADAAFVYDAQFACVSAAREADRFAPNHRMKGNELLYQARLKLGSYENLQAGILLRLASEAVEINPVGRFRRIWELTMARLDAVRGEYDAARSRAKALAESLLPMEDDAVLVLTRFLLHRIAYRRGEFDRAERALREARTRLAKCSDSVHFNGLEHYDRWIRYYAARLAIQRLDVARDFGSSNTRAQALDLAEQDMLALGKIYRDAERPTAYGRVLRLLARCSVLREDLREADTRLRDSLSAIDEEGDPGERAASLLELGAITLQSGDAGAAGSSVLRAFEMFRRLGIRPGVMRSAAVLADVCEQISAGGAKHDLTRAARNLRAFAKHEAAALKILPALAQCVLGGTSRIVRARPVKDSDVRASMEICSRHLPGGSVAAFVKEVSGWRFDVEERI